MLKIAPSTQPASSLHPLSQEYLGNHVDKLVLVRGPALGPVLGQQVVRAQLAENRGQIRLVNALEIIRHDMLHGLGEPAKDIQELGKGKPLYLEGVGEKIQLSFHFLGRDPVQPEGSIGSQGGMAGERYALGFGIRSDQKEGTLFSQHKHSVMGVFAYQTPPWVEARLFSWYPFCGSAAQ